MKGMTNESIGRAFSLVFVLPVAALILLPLGLPLMLLMAVVAGPVLIPYAWLTQDDPAEFIRETLSFPVKALLGMLTQFLH